MEVVLETKGLTKVYGDLTAVDHVDLQVFSGEVYSMLGPNGAGKTTTVEILEGLRDPTSGEAKVLGIDLRKAYKEVRGKVGVLPQLFEPWDNLKPPEAVSYWSSLFGRDMEAKQVKDLLNLVGLGDKQKVLGARLSGGEKRRLGIAMALVGNPELIFLDEPTTGLDPQARRGLWEVIRDLRKAGKTIFLTTHYLEEAEELADRVAIMNRGKIVASGSPDELITLHGGGTILVLKGAGEEGLKAVESLGLLAQMDGRDVQIRIPPLQRTKDVIANITRANVPFKDIDTIRPVLEDVFFNMVGGKLVEGVVKP